jgi:hypothetical protein
VSGVQSLSSLPRRTASALVRRWLASASSHYGQLGRLDQDFPERRDVLRITVQKDLVIDVFWKSLKAGKGPALSLFVCGEEFAKFDCFGPGDGHYHLALFAPAGVRQHGLQFAERTVAEQIGRTIFEIAKNLGYYLERAASPAIRKFELQRESLLSALPMAEKRMREFLCEVPELREP